MIVTNCSVKISDFKLEFNCDHLFLKKVKLHFNVYLQSKVNFKCYFILDVCSQSIWIYMNLYLFVLFQNTKVM